MQAIFVYYTDDHFLIEYFQVKKVLENGLNFCQKLISLIFRTFLVLLGTPNMTAVFFKKGASSFGTKYSRIDQEKFVEDSL